MTRTKASVLAITLSLSAGQCAAQPAAPLPSSPVVYAPPPPPPRTGIFAPPPPPGMSPSARFVTPPPARVTPMAAPANSLRIAVRSTPPLPAPNVPAAVNLAGLARVMQMFPKGCAPFQAAPGVFVRLDCKKYGQIQGAKVANLANKLRLFRAGELRLDPQAINIATPPLFLTGLQALFGGGGGASPANGGVAAPEQSLPASVDHRTQGTEGPVKDQQLVGACTAFSLSTVMDNAIRRLNRTDVVSAMHIWSRYADPTMESADARNQGRAVALWADYPYDQRTACRMEREDDGCASLMSPPVQVNTANDPAIQQQIRNAEARGRYTISEIDQITPIDPDALALDLATGKDIWFGMEVSQDAWTGAQVQSTAVIPDWLLEDGGHAFVLSGYRTTMNGRQFLVHNSWGTSWGDHGYGWVSETMIKAHAQYAYTIKVVDPTAAPPPATPVATPQPNGQTGCASGFALATGSPLCQRICASDADCGAGGTCVAGAGNVPRVCVASNPLTDDDCGENELVDIVTAQCAPACPNGSRPAAGFCGFNIPR